MDINEAMKVLNKAIKGTESPDIAYEIWNYAMELTEVAFDKRNKLGGKKAPDPVPKSISQPSLAVLDKLCVACNKPVDEKSFTDAASFDEYRVSGMCQKCQDERFKL